MTKVIASLGYGQLRNVQTQRDANNNNANFSFNPVPINVVKNNICALGYDLSQDDSSRITPDLVIDGTPQPIH